MEELLDLMVTDESPSQISDKIKDILFAKSAERVEASRPFVADSLFGDDTEIEDEIEERYGLENSSDEQDKARTSLFDDVDNAQKIN